MSEAGAKVLNAQAVQFAKEAKIVLHARSTFNPGNETVIRESPVLEKSDVLSVVYEKDISRIFLHETEKVEWLLNFLNENQIPVKEFHQSGIAGDKGYKCSFIISTNNLYNWDNIKETLEENIREGIYINESLSALSIIGEGFNRNNSVLIKTLEILKQNSIEIYGVNTTSFRISILVERELLEFGVKVCHEFWIDKP